MEGERIPQRLMELRRIHEAAHLKYREKRKSAAVVSDELKSALSEYDNFNIEEKDLLKLLKKYRKKVKKVRSAKDKYCETWEDYNNY